MNGLMAAIVYCIVGSNTGSPELTGLSVLRCDTETGRIEKVQTVEGIQGTTYFDFSKDGKWLYSMVGRKVEGKRRPDGAVVRFAYAAGKIGNMEKVADIPGGVPCHVVLSQDGERLLFASYGSATAGSVSLANGSVNSATLPNEGMGPNKKRQQKAYAHFAFETPDAKKVGTIDLGCDKIHFWRNDGDGRFVGKAVLQLNSDPGDGPRHAVWSKDGNFMYVVNELGNSVTAYAYDGKGFKRTGKWSTLPDGFAGETKAAAIKLTGDGKILMASNRGHDSIAFFAVNGGELRLRNIAKLTGKFPRDFELMPGEKFMIAGHKMSNEVQVYRFDRERCELTPEGNPVEIWRPLCFKFSAKSGM